MTDFFRDFSFKSILNFLEAYIGYDGPLSIIKVIVDISIVAYFIYKLVQLVKETRAWQLLKGVIIIVGAAYLSGFLGLRTVETLLKNSLQLIGIALIVLFQPELRRGLEQIGRSNFREIFSSTEESGLIKTTAAIEEIVKAATEMSKTMTGALIVIERDTKIGEIINTGTQIDSNLSSELLLNIFVPNTPLHDGAVIIRNNRIIAAACFLPLTDNPNLSKDLGTRHRAALGITEVSDSITVVVSEETGKISFALNGGLTRNLTSDTLRKALNKNLLERNTPNRKLALWKVRAK